MPSVAFALSPPMQPRARVFTDHLPTDMTLCEPGASPDILVVSELPPEASGPRVVVLTGSQDCVPALLERAGDAIHVPFPAQGAAIREFWARVRRVAVQAGGEDVSTLKSLAKALRPVEAAPVQAVRVGDLLLDIKGGRGVLSGKPFYLTPTERAILRLLVERAPAAVPQRDIMSVVFGWPEEAVVPVECTAPARVHIGRLRRKLEGHGHGRDSQLVRTAGNSRGYAWEGPVPE